MAAVCAWRGVAGLRAAFAAYTGDPARQARNERALHEDALGSSAMGVLWLAVAAKTWRGGETGLALLAASYVLNELGQTALMRRAPRFRAARIRWRELFFLFTCLHMTVTVLALALWSRSSVLATPGGSALRLALLLCVANGSLVQALYWPFSGIPLPFVAAALPVILTVPLASSKALCMRLLEDGTARQPLETLHALLGAAHSGLVAIPYTWPPPQPPLQLCHEVNTYLLCMLGCALPLLWACRMHTRQRRRLQLQGEAEVEASPGAWVLRPLTCLVLASCSAWCASGVAALVYRRWG